LSYNCVFNIFISGIFGVIYYFAGADSFKQIFIGVFLSAVFGIINGAPMGYVIDLLRNLFGLENNRTTNFVKPSKLLGVIFVLASLFMIVLLYLTKKFIETVYLSQ
jgi:ABC-type multidrug transport system fused ATPase/permease subunit